MSTFIGVIAKDGNPLPIKDFIRMVNLSDNKHHTEFLTGIRKDLSTVSLTGITEDKDYSEFMGICFLGLSASELEQNTPANGVEQSCTTIFDGEIYAFNGRDLSDSDNYPDFLSGRYEADHTDCFNKLNAQFLALVIDKRHQQIILARDKHGSKSGFYYESEAYFCFANSARFLLKSPGYKVAVDEAGFWNNLSFPAPPQPLTVYKGIKALERGHYIEIGKSSRISKYYDIPYRVQNQNLDEYEAGRLINDAMKKAVKRRTKGKSTIGAPISGGVDSPYICALASERLSKMDVYTFSLKDPAFAPMNEHEKASLTAKKYGLNHHVKFYEVTDLLADYDNIVRMYEQVGNNFGTYYYVAKQAAELGNGVILTGLAADESHGGFHYFKYIKLWQTIKLFPSITKLIPRGLNASLEDLKNLSLATTIDDYYAHAFSNLKEREKRLVFPNIRGYHSHNTIHELYNSENRNFTDDVEGLLYFMFANVPNHHLYRFEQFSNYFGLKVRHPFLDDDVVEAAFQVPSIWKVKGDVRKIALKRAAEPYLPKESLVKKKLGLTIPLGAWLNNDLSEFTHSHLTNLKKREQVSGKGVDYIYNTYRHIKPAKVMKLIMTELWFKNFMDKYS